MKNIGKVVAISAICAMSLEASGYKIPEQSLSAVALGAANVAAVKGADASYYNPANMAWMSSGYHLDLALTYINLPKVKFDGTAGLITKVTGTSKSETEHFLLPTGHLVTKEYYENWRFGLSIVAPGGLSKRWDSAPGRDFAQDFTLKIIEVNPTAAYRVNDKFAVGFGLRAIYTDGVVKSDTNVGAPFNLSRDMNGDSIDYGFNLALSFKPVEDITLAATYRSKVDLTVKGNAKLESHVGDSYNGKANVTIPLPAVLTLAAAKKFNNTTIEAVYERVFWSKYKNLDFGYAKPLAASLLGFDTPSPKNWKDVDTYRLGLTHEYNHKLTLMAGIGIDKNPAPEKTLGFELPDSDAMIYSAGFKYKITKDLDIGLAYLMSDKKSRTVKNDNIDGKFKDSAAHLVSTGISYRF